MKQNHLQLTNECHNLLAQLSQLAIGSNDRLMQEFINNQREQINEAKSINSLNGIKTNLNAAIESLKLSDEINKVINQFRKEQNHWYTSHMKAKADKIENAMTQIPIEERNQIFTRNEPRFVAVRVALATHRHLGKRGDVYFKQGSTTEIDLEYAATSYKNLHHRFFTPLTTKNKVEEVDDNNQLKDQILK